LADTQRAYDPDVLIVPEPSFTIAAIAASFSRFASVGLTYSFFMLIPTIS
jgi:hypothetical protein